MNRINPPPSNIRVKNTPSKVELKNINLVSHSLTIGMVEFDNVNLSPGHVPDLDNLIIGPI